MSSTDVKDVPVKAPLMTTHDLLLVEDDPLVAENVVELLEGFEFKVEHVTHAEACFDAVSRREPTLILLDIELPGLTGHEICRVLRERNYRRIPIIGLSGCQDDEAVVKMLEAGADDFVPKSQAFPILLAHIRAVLKRGQRLLESAKNPAQRAAWGPIEIDKTSRRVWISNQEAPMTPTEAGLLETFISSPGAVFTRGQLIDRLHGAGHVTTPRTVDVHINGVRAHLGKYRAALETVRGVGYRFAQTFRPEDY